MQSLGNYLKGMITTLLFFYVCTCTKNELMAAISLIIQYHTMEITWLSSNDTSQGEHSFLWSIIYTLTGSVELKLKDKGKLLVSS